MEHIHFLLFLWSEDLTCDWLKHKKHSRHILVVHGLQVYFLIAAEAVFTTLKSQFFLSFYKAANDFFSLEKTYVLLRHHLLGRTKLILLVRHNLRK